MRRVITIASRGVILRRRLPREHGGAQLYVSPETGLRYWTQRLADVDPSLLAFAGRFVEPGMRVFDVGANVGLFTFASAYHAGRSGQIVALEPDVEMARLLVRSRRAFDRERNAPVALLCVAASRPGARISRFAVAESARATNALETFGTKLMGGTREVQHVVTVTLDELAQEFGMPHLVKIDVEEAEALVLEGASRVLAEARPILHLEIAAENRDRLTELLRAHGYRFFDATRPASPGPALERATGFCIALPSDRARSRA